MAGLKPSALRALVASEVTAASLDAETHMGLVFLDKPELDAGDAPRSFVVRFDSLTKRTPSTIALCSSRETSFVVEIKYDSAPESQDMVADDARHVHDQLDGLSGNTNVINRPETDSVYDPDLGVATYTTRIMHKVP